ncbi:uncharacterized protein At1g66480-like [Rhodamnia argentea]|uniref:Uncharacterized protein At1g66480-like n=1 Tax=Rhodamnia argentea TaxID=178133 RepID=A0A8B8P6U3_9MYRT|nr:uncharacterized protein At1g66480-like [Rhodamnia argentea]
MGNGLGLRRNRRAKVMKINGETMKLRTPVRACQVVDDHPGHVLLDSESVKRFGIRARPLEPHHELKPEKLYFLVELPKFPNEHEKAPRRVRSGIQMGAKDRLECLMLSRRAESDMIRPTRASFRRDSAAPVQVKMRIPRAQLDKLMEESMDDAEVAQRIVDLYMGNVGVLREDKHLGSDQKLLMHQRQECHWKPAVGGIRESFMAPAVRFSSPSTSLNSRNANLSSFH